jgi:hypothetical protein
MAPNGSLVPQRVSKIPSLVPQRAFTDEEDGVFAEMDDDADIDALVAILFPEA